MNALIIIALLILQGCFHPRPDDIMETTSEFDGATEISMRAISAFPEKANGPAIQFEPFWRSTMQNDRFVLTLWAMNTVSFASVDPVRFNIDGEIVSLNSSEAMQFYYNPGMVGHGIYISPWSKSGKRFLVSKTFLEKILHAKRVVIRIDLENGYTEATFSSPTQSDQRAKKHMQKFYNKIFTASDHGEAKPTFSTD